MRLPLIGEKVSWLKGFFLFYLFFLVLFFAAAPFLTLWMYAQTSLTKSLLPQLIGFCLQGGFLVIVFALYEKRSTIDARRNWKFTLRSFLSPFVDHCLPDWKSMVNNSEKLLPPPEILQQSIHSIRSDGLQQKLGVELQQIAQRNLIAMESLSVVAAQIDHIHLNTWMAIIHHTRALTNALTEAEQRTLVVNLLEDVVKFDESYIF
ncbi:MAG: hypothetical protein HQL93_03550 [Magnetococcales bacterium]|nr:hypothetical protein [Magnetococcales bacterium]